MPSFSSRPRDLSLFHSRRPRTNPTPARDRTNLRNTLMKDSYHQFKPTKTSRWLDRCSKAAADDRLLVGPFTREGDKWVLATLATHDVHRDFRWSRTKSFWEPTNATCCTSPYINRGVTFRLASCPSQCPQQTNGKLTWPAEIAARSRESGMSTPPRRRSVHRNKCNGWSTRTPCHPGTSTATGTPGSVANHLFRTHNQGALMEMKLLSVLKDPAVQLKSY
ncbi:hypothetical protein SARC_02210 [Sphaeroforma arctica JP610]|uniref:Uncharacterized protein n=1 Tax=Sphaeroforma arctica JP610 TaxID=667725 RepID=A0A0L0G9E5_9EUKA|nr:hypothetical protein SARC_02210 [Sphaeroforma arctica JP610]KNC85637.1 hypothetical protein SARC_02210 [Sphaeroforma arctica JP610]|eukprot:XP_014159539.1 hypothetical protein SARC_02210 [Sphaeroforma arctica JP610]